jgi:hypothetical protein
VVNRIRRRGTKLVPIEAVEAVCPMRRVLYLRRRRSAPTRAAVGGVSALAPYGRRAARTTASSAGAMWAYGAPRVGASARAGAGAAREQWPAVRQGGIAFTKATAVLVAVIAAAIWSFAVACCRWLAPRSARLAKASFASTARGVRSLGHQGAREIARVKRPQVVQPLPHADELHGQPELLGDRDGDAALGRAVELR